MVNEKTKQWLMILDLKNEIENMKLTISNVNLSIEYSKNRNHTTKLKQKKIFLTRRLKDLCEQKNKLEKQYAFNCKAEERGRYTW